MLLSTLAMIVVTGMTEGKLPNIAFVLMDDLGYNDAGWRDDGPSTDLGHAWPETKKYADEGVVMYNYYTQPICTPTRAAFMTGRYPIRLGLQRGVINPGTPVGLPLHEVTLADKLKKVGYRTLGVGKWHLGAHSNGSLPTNRGFDEWYGLWYGWAFYWNHSLGIGGPGSCEPGLCYLDLHDGIELDKSQNGTYATFLFSDKVNESLQSHKRKNDTKPFFLYYAMQNVHGPLESPEKWMSKAPCDDILDPDRQIFCALALMADMAFFNLTKIVDSLFPQEELVYIVSGDNGGNPRDGGNNMPLRGRKSTLWEGGVRNNAFIWSNSEDIIPKKSEHKKYKSLMHVTDWHATILEIAGVQDDLQLDGMSHLDAIKNGKEGPRIELLHNIDPYAGGPNPDTAGQYVEAAYRMGDWKLLLNVSDSPHYPLENPCEDVIEGVHPSRVPQPVRLYNITNDPEENNDIYAMEPDIVKNLTDKIYKLYKEQLFPCNCGDYCPEGVNDCPFDEASAELAEKAGGWVPWLEDSTTAWLSQDNTLEV